MLAIANIFEQRKMGHEFWYVALSFCTAMVLVVGVLAFFDETILEMTGGLLLPFLIASFFWFVYQGKKDLEKMKPFEDMSRQENKILRRVSIVLTVLFFIPAFMVGVLAGIK